MPFFSISIVNFDCVIAGLDYIEAKHKNTLVPENASDEKNLHSGDRKYIFLTNLIEFFK